jgi:zinc transport system permease protein
VTVVLSMKVVGIMLISALLIFPAVTALQVARSFKAVMLTASLSAMASVVSGLVLSFSLDLPTGATIVLINFVFFLTGLTYRRIIKA